MVDNDANVAAYAEVRFGAARGMTDAMVITLGTGIGGGVLVGGTVLRGAHGFAAEVGHFQIDPNGPMCACGERGHWEAMASGNALGEDGREAAARAATCRACCTPSTARSTRSAARTSRTPPAPARPTRSRSSTRTRSTSRSASSGLANIFDPAVIAIAGGLVNDGDLFLAPITRHFLGHIEGHDYRPTPEHRPRAARRAGGRHRRRRRVALDAPTPGCRERVGAVVKVGLTLPSFTEDPETPLRVAAAAEAAGVDGIFVYDHLFRIGRNGEMRPALECMALLGAVAAETTRITLGTLVVRATLRPPTTLATALDTVVRIAGPRLVVGLGAGDEESRPEMETFGLPMGTETDRVKRLRASLREIADRPYPAWVGGRARHVGLVAAESAKGWNRWGLDPEEFAVEAAEVASLVRRLNPDPDVVHHELGWPRGARRRRRCRGREGRAARRGRRHHRRRSAHRRADARPLPRRRRRLGDPRAGRRRGPRRTPTIIGEELCPRLR